MARCLGKLGEYTRSSDEFNRAFDEIKALRKRRGTEAGHADDLKRRAVQDMAEMVVDAMKDGAEIRAKVP
jgi:hypothetical protein